MSVHIASALLLAAAAVGGAAQPAAGPVRVIFNLASQRQMRMLRWR